MMCGKNLVVSWCQYKAPSHVMSLSFTNLAAAGLGTYFVMFVLIQVFKEVFHLFLLASVLFFMVRK